MDQPARSPIDRPNWSAIGDMIGELRRAMGGLNESQREMLKVTGSGWSPDRTIKAVVGPRGQLLELEIDPRVFRKPNSKALAALIVSTVRLAVEDASEKVQSILDRNIPSDMRIKP